jgi:hypothetical protein
MGGSIVKRCFPQDEIVILPLGADRLVHLNCKQSLYKKAQTSGMKKLAGPDPAGQVPLVVGREGIMAQRIAHLGLCRCRLSRFLPPLGRAGLTSGGAFLRSLASLRIICLHRSTKASSTFALLRALVSKYGVFQSRDVAKAFGRGMARSSSRSDLLPTSTMGTLSSSLIRRICSRSSASSWNDDADVMAKTRRNPWPVFMYNSLLGVSSRVVT